MDAANRKEDTTGYNCHLHCRYTMVAIMNRRQFLSIAPAIIPGSALGLNGAVAPSNRIALAIIGTGNQGFNDLKSFLRDERVQITSVCDVNRESPGYWDGGIAGPLE